MKLLLKSVLCVYVCLFKVGACIVNQDNKIVGIGYNGMPNGCDDDLLPWSRCAENKLDTKYPYGQNQHINTQIHTNTLIWHPYLKVQLLATGHKNIHFLHVLNEWLFRLAIKQHQTSKQTVFFFLKCVTLNSTPSWIRTALTWRAAACMWRCFPAMSALNSSSRLVCAFSNSSCSDLSLSLSLTSFVLLLSPTPLTLSLPPLSSGLKEVIYLSDKYHHTPEMTASRRLLSMAGVHFRSLSTELFF